MVYLVYGVLLVAVGFILLMIQTIMRDARRRSHRHREIQDRHLGR